MCSKHYNRHRTTGTVEDGPRARAPLAVRFWRQVAKGGPDECWNWTGHQNGHGYGKINLGGGKGAGGTHRVSWELHHGPIRDGLFVCHRCDNRACVNPAHLFLGTQGDNLADAAAKGRMPGAKRGRKHPPKPGASNPNAKITAEQAHRAKYTNAGAQALADEFGVSKATIYAIRQGRIWRDL